MSTSLVDHDDTPVQAHLQEVADGVFAYVQPDGSCDLPGALGDMVTYNGGRPLTCLA